MARSCSAFTRVGSSMTDGSCAKNARMILMCSTSIEPGALPGRGDLQLRWQRLPSQRRAWPQGGGLLHAPARLTAPDPQPIRQHMRRRAAQLLTRAGRQLVDELVLARGQPAPPVLPTLQQRQPLGVRQRNHRLAHRACPTQHPPRRRRPSPGQTRSNSYPQCSDHHRQIWPQAQAPNPIRAE